ncbi:LamG domain-containing protein [Micromonospora sp. WMMA1998]|uniref:LamG domain-containing protein n=1 Tax=Micromonospora sp. WMMA1998 TaxID=3015167 RepID=UPI00248AAF5B|nr:LamG domain-containing protein [Micromonospora sp. WMMA1998]WBC17746.1 LamG domain-containing protein [Micromonospora sp. WMMA1998]
MSAPSSGSAEADAIRLAVDTKRAVEVAGSKSESSRVVATPAGTLVHESYAMPRWTKGTDQRWRQIDTRLTTAGGVVKPVATLADVRFSSGGSAPLVDLAGEDGSLQLSWPTALPVPSVEGPTAVYPSVLPDVDLRVTATADGFGYVLVVKTRQAAANPALSRLRLGLKSSGWSVNGRAEGGFEARNSAGELAASAGRALMWDASGVPAGARTAAGARAAGTESVLQRTPDLSRKAELPTTIEDSGLVIVPEKAMLTDPATVFPVVIDPWTTIVKSRWGYTNSSNATRDDGIVRVGSNPDNSGNYRSFFAFNLSGLAGKSVRSVKFITEMTHSWSCTSSPVNLWRSADLTTSGKQSWDGPNLEKYIEQRSGHAHKPSGGAGCGDDPQPDMYMEFASATLKSDLISVGQGTTNYTLALSTRDSDGTDESTESRWKKFDAAQTKLSVEYNTAPATATAAQLTTHADYTAPAQPCATGTGRPIVRSTTPWLKATLSDPDGTNGGLLSGTFALQKWNGTAWLGVTGWPKVDSGVPTGTKAEVQIPSGVVTGGLIRWQVQTKDTLGGSSNWSPWCEFDYDVTPPALTPTVTPADGTYAETPPNDVHLGSVGLTGRFTLGANGQADVYDYEYQLDGGAISYVTAAGLGGNATVLITPQHSGENVLTVRARDRSQNRSAPKDYRFLVAEPTAPKAVWRLDEGTGSDLLTTPAGGPTATLANGTTWTEGRLPGTHVTNGKDSALKFDGVDDEAATAGPVLDTSKTFAVSAWAKMTGKTSYFRSVLCQESTQNCGFALEYAPAPIDRWVLDMYSGDIVSPTVIRVTSKAPPAIGVWTHLAAEWDAGTRTARLYVNGVEQGTVQQNTNFNASGRLLLGRAKYNGTVNNPWWGEVSEVRVWDRGLVPDVDIAPQVEPVLAAAWEMEDWDEDAPRQVLDESTYRSPLTLADAPAVQWCDGYNLSGGLCFDGTSGSATTVGPALRSDQSYTISAWLRPDANDGTRTAIAQEGNVVSGLFLGCRTNTTPQWAFMQASGVDYSTKQVWGAPCSVNTWTHVVGVYDATAGQQRLYVNGKLIASGALPTGWHAAGAFTVGRAKWGSPVDFWNGGIDRVRLWQGVISDQEVDAQWKEA